MIIYYTIATVQAVYEFQVNANQARVTRWILKGGRGTHASTSMSTQQARKLAQQIKAK